MKTHNVALRCCERYTAHSQRKKGLLDRRGWATVRNGRVDPTMFDLDWSSDYEPDHNIGVSVNRCTLHCGTPYRVVYMNFYVTGWAVSPSNVFLWPSGMTPLDAPYIVYGNCWCRMNNKCMLIRCENVKISFSPLNAWRHTLQHQIRWSQEFDCCRPNELCILLNMDVTRRSLPPWRSDANYRWPELVYHIIQSIICCIMVTSPDTKWSFRDYWDIERFMQLSPTCANNILLNESVPTRTDYV